jgi:transcriptional regulator with XRE-family HTH domain
MRTPKSVHPLWAVRTALKKSQSEFGKMFGLSGSYIQAIELGGRKLRDELADDIMLALGVTAESLQRKRGMPTPLLQEKRIAKMMDRETCAAIISELRRLENKAGGRLRFQIDLWRKILPALQGSIRYQNTTRKLFLLLNAATHERKHLLLLARLDRWMENAVKKFRLKSRIMNITGGSYGEDWQPFKEMMRQDLPFLLPQKKQRRIRQTITGKVTLPPKGERKRRKRS